MYDGADVLNDTEELEIGGTTGADEPIVKLPLKSGVDGAIGNYKSDQSDILLLANFSNSCALE